MVAQSAERLTGSGPVRRVMEPSCRCRSACRSAGLVRPADVGGPAELLAEPDQPGGDVDLTAQRRRAGRRSGRSGAGCARTRRRTGWPASSRCATCPGSNSSLPKVWQIELIDQVTWCRNADPDEAGPEERGHRALPGHGPQAADQGGRQQRDATSAGNDLETLTTFLSASRSGQNFSCEVCSLSNSQPMCAQTRPLQGLPVVCRTATASAGRPPGRCTCGAAGGRRPRSARALDRQRAGDGERDSQAGLALNEPWVK